MQNDPVEIVRKFLEGAFCPEASAALVHSDAVFVDLSPAVARLQQKEGGNVAVGKAEFIEAAGRLLGHTCSGELVVTSLFGSGRNVAGFGTMIRAEGPDRSEVTAPVSIWAKVSFGRLRFMQYLEFGQAWSEEHHGDVLEPSLAAFRRHKQLRLIAG